MLGCMTRPAGEDMLDVPNGWTEDHDAASLDAKVRSYLALSRYARVLVPSEAERLETLAACWFYRLTRVDLLQLADVALRDALHAEMNGERERAAVEFRRAASWRRDACAWASRAASFADALAVVDREDGVRDTMHNLYPFGVRR